MRAAIYASALLLAIAPQAAWAANCSGHADYVQLNATQVGNLLNGNTACYPPGGPYENQEAHTGGTITDYKKGPDDPVDKSAVVGSYTIDGAGNITYNYSGGTTFTYEVWGPAPGGNNPAVGTYFYCPLGAVQIEAGTGHGC